MAGRVTSPERAHLFTLTSKWLPLYLPLPSSKSSKLQTQTVILLSLSEFLIKICVYFSMRCLVKFKGKCPQQATRNHISFFFIFILQCHYYLHLPLHRSWSPKKKSKALMKVTVINWSVKPVFRSQFKTRIQRNSITWSFENWSSSNKQTIFGEYLLASYLSINRIYYNTITFV